MHFVTYNGGSNIFAIMINIIILSVDKSKAGATNQKKGMSMIKIILYCSKRSYNLVRQIPWSTIN
jgi:hypothetical protein